ncbi:FAD-dependent oxidoreductase [Gracilibacillus halophilus YIM-C55.5]|uniref:FAD-dependent oxidoreductase n=1 Tax=Gracilibacillus halophilus YIM-C55.5 TaxID=1308866 RepID=N4WZF5_9BACI|nr:NAD(P)/FAD-dependent oxidoreductase [Gracilibacillus halophilus]ENH98411.1 FAD-dependent oxidoreductase [Gracilibacillus halophilus YIM-C55.5]
MKRVVLIGGGYGGMNALHQIIENDIPSDVQITVIDRNPYHSLKTEFYAIAAGTKSDKEVRIDFPIHEQIYYVFGEVVEINTEEQKILLRDNEVPVTYDFLLIGLGCEDNYHGIQGAAEYTESVQSIAKARQAGLRINSLPAYSQVSVVGAGLSGIEVASEVRESRPDLNIRLLDRGSSVLSAFDKKIQSYVEEWFREHEVQILHHSNVELVADGIFYNNGEGILSDVIIWTAGVRPHRLVRSLPFEKDRHDKIIVNEYYQVPGNPTVFAVGDCATSEHSPSAQLAGQQGEQIGQILADILQGKQPKKPKDIKLKGQLGSLGKSDGFGNMYSQPMTGLLPRLAKSGVLWLNKRH